MAISRTAAAFRKTGDTLDYTDAAAVPCGAVLVVCGLNCIALSSIAQGEKGALKILQRGEVIEVTTDEAIGETAAGTAIYLDPASGLVTKSADDGEDTPTAYPLLGYTAKAIGADSLTFDVVCV